MTVGSQCEGIGAIALALCSQSLVHLFGLNSFFKLKHIVATTGEVDAATQSTNGEEADEDEGHYSPQNEGLLVGTDDVEVLILHEVARDRRSKGQVQPLVLIHAVLVNKACEEHGGEERAADTDDKCDGEATHGPCTDDGKDDTSENTGQVGVEYG